MSSFKGFYRTLQFLFSFCFTFVMLKNYELQVETFGVVFFFIKARTNSATLNYSMTLKPVTVSNESNYNLHTVKGVCLP